MATLTTKEKFARLNLSKLPDDYQKEFKTIQESTENFSDDDLVAVFQENFDDLYSLVQTKYSAAIETGGTVKKTRPTKVKTVRKKKDKPAGVGAIDKTWTEVNLTEFKKDHPKYQDKGHRLKAGDIEFIEDQLTNNESSTDEEMIEHFVSELGISKAQAKKWVDKRDKYLKEPVEKRVKYSERTKLKKAARKEKSSVKTRDGYTFDRKDPDNKGKKFYDENGKKWTCKGYSSKLDECIMTDDDGKEVSACLRDMYVNNPIEKRKKGDIVDECRETLKEAGYKILSHKKGKKQITRKEPRPEKEIIKERVENTFTPITKDLVKSGDAAKENKEVIEVLNRIQGLFVKVFNRISNLADDGKAEKLEKIEELLKELIEG